MEGGLATVGRTLGRMSVALAFSVLAHGTAAASDQFGLDFPPRTVCRQVPVARGHMPPPTVLQPQNLLARQCVRKPNRRNAQHSEAKGAERRNRVSRP